MCYNEGSLSETALSAGNTAPSLATMKGLSSMADTTYSSAPAQTSQSTFVYFISSGSTPIKIGVSNDPAARLSELQTAHYQKLHLLYTVECASRAQAFELEKAFHRWYDEKRIRNEWYDLTPAQITSDVNLLMTLSRSVVGIYQHVSPEQAEQLEDQAERKANIRKQVAYSKNMNAKQIVSDWLRGYVGEHPEVWTMSTDDFHALVMSETKAQIGRTSAHNVRAEMKAQS